MLLLMIAFAYFATAAVFYFLVAKLAPVKDEPVWFLTAPPRSSQVIELFQQNQRHAA
jgi:hypothetical protein